jgi:hypothetical protein
MRRSDGEGADCDCGCVGDGGTVWEPVGIEMGMGGTEDRGSVAER